MIKKFRGTAKEKWEEQCRLNEYVKPFREERYLISMTNGDIEVINPFIVVDTRNWNDFRHFDSRDNNYLRFVLDDYNIIDIPKENIIYINTKYGRFISKDEYLEKELEKDELIELDGN